MEQDKIIEENQEEVVEEGEEFEVQNNQPVQEKENFEHEEGSESENQSSENGEEDGDAFVMQERNENNEGEEEGENYEENQQFDNQDDDEFQAVDNEDPEVVEAERIAHEHGSFIEDEGEVEEGEQIQQQEEQIQPQEGIVEEEGEQIQQEGEVEEGEQIQQQEEISEQTQEEQIQPQEEQIQPQEKQIQIQEEQIQIHEEQIQPQEEQIQIQEEGQFNEQIVESQDEKSQISQSIEQVVVIQPPTPQPQEQEKEEDSSSEDSDSDEEEKEEEEEKPAVVENEATVPAAEIQPVEEQKTEEKPAEATVQEEETTETQPLAASAPETTIAPATTSDGEVIESIPVEAVPQEEDNLLTATVKRYQIPEKMEVTSSSTQFVESVQWERKTEEIKAQGITKLVQSPQQELLFVGGAISPSTIKFNTSKNKAIKISIPKGPSFPKEHPIPTILDKKRNSILVFDSKPDRLTLFKYNISMNKYEIQYMGENNEKFPVHSYSMVLRPLDEKIYIYGGINADNELNNNLLAFNLKDNTLSIVTPKNNPEELPCARFAHACVYFELKDVMIVHGGLKGMEETQDNLCEDSLYEYIFMEEKWNKINTQLNVLRARHAATCLCGDLGMLIHGGSQGKNIDTHNEINNDEIFSNLYVLDLYSFKWRSVKLADENEKLIARQNFSMTSDLYTKAYFAGGKAKDENQTLPNEIYQVEIQLNQQK